jgi:hypothetical protein
MTGCDADERCPDDSVCEDGRCRSGCRDDESCPFGAVCEPTARHCHTGCRTDAGCATGAICRDGQCTPGCREHHLCRPQEHCNVVDTSSLDALMHGASGVCVADCVDDTHCATGSVCANPGGECRPGCRTDEACALGGHCDLTRLECAAGCNNDPNRCAVGEACVRGTCSATACHEAANPACRTGRWRR